MILELPSSCLGRKRPDILPSRKRWGLSLNGGWLLFLVDTFGVWIFGDWWPAVATISCFFLLALVADLSVRYSTLWCCRCLVLVATLIVKEGLEFIACASAVDAESSVDLEAYNRLTAWRLGVLTWQSLYAIDAAFRRWWRIMGTSCWPPSWGGSNLPARQIHEEGVLRQLDPEVLVSCADCLGSSDGAVLSSSTFPVRGLKQP